MTSQVGSQQGCGRDFARYIRAWQPRPEKGGEWAWLLLI